MQIYEIWAFLKDLVWIELMAWKCAPRLFFMKRKELYKYLTLIIFQGRTYEIYKYSPLRYTNAFYSFISDDSRNRKDFIKI